MRSLSFLLVLFLSRQASPFSAIQTDWSGGYGGEGPVTVWSALLNDMECADYCNIPGEVSASLRENRLYNGLQRMFSSMEDIDMDGDIDVAGRSQYVDGLF